MRTVLLIATTSTALLLGGCAHIGATVPGGTHPAENADHPRAETVLARDRNSARARDTDKNAGRDRMNDSASPRLPASTAAPVAARDPAATLREGLRLYHAGEFNNAITKLTAPEIQGAQAAMRLIALKYTAFSYCVTQRPAPCRQAFERALQIDPGFTLAPGEEGHPMWGPVFDKARAKP